MKNIVIIGPPRSGKTTLAKMIVKNINNYSLLSLDNFKASYIRACKESFDNESSIENIINLVIPKKQCFYYLLESSCYENDIAHVVDFSAYDEKLFKEFAKNSIIIFFTYPKLTKNELFKRIRKFDTENDWTYYESDNNLNMFCENFIEQSSKFEKYAKENNFVYIDVSNNREKVIKDTFNKIKKQIENDYTNL